MTRYILFCATVAMIILGAWSFNYEAPRFQAGISYKGVFGIQKFDDGYIHYIYWVEPDEFNNSNFPSYLMSDGMEYIDLGVAKK